MQKPSLISLFHFVCLCCQRQTDHRQQNGFIYFLLTSVSCLCSTQRLLSVQIKSDHSLNRANWACQMGGFTEKDGLIVRVQGNQDFDFGQVKFRMSISCYSGDNPVSIFFNLFYSFIYS